MFENVTVGLLWIASTYFFVNVILGVLDGLKTVNVELRNQIHKRLDEIIHRVQEEQHNDVIYWYDQDDGEFLAQGRNQQEIIDVLKSRFPDHLFYLASHQIISKPHWQPKDLPSTGLQVDHKILK
jgi:hypothetical protein